MSESKDKERRPNTEAERQRKLTSDFDAAMVEAYWGAFQVDGKLVLEDAYTAGIAYIEAHPEILDLGKRKLVTDKIMSIDKKERADIADLLQRPLPGMPDPLEAPLVTVRGERKKVGWIEPYVEWDGAWVIQNDEFQVSLERHTKKSRVNAHIVRHRGPQHKTIREVLKEFPLVRSEPEDDAAG